MADYSGNTTWPIGMRQNNPGNIRPGLSIWMGSNGSNGGFLKFTDTKWGLRAMAVDLSNKMIGDGLTTITAIITKYAPPSENNTQAYIDSVSDSTGWDADEQLDPSAQTLASLIKAQLKVEQGSYASNISDADINEGIAAIPQSLKDKLTDFFVEHPALATAAGVSVLALVAAVIFSIASPKGFQSFKKIFSK